MIRLFAALGLVALSACLQAQPAATDALLAALRPLHSVQGEFRQQQFDESGASVAQSSGSFKLLRPGFFTWEITSPDSQLIIADPEYLWHHDRDLETVTRRPVSDSEQMSPLQILGGNESLLRERFEVTRSGESSFDLRPVGIDPGFQRLLVSFASEGFSALEIADNLNQRIVITFSKVDIKSQLAPQDFKFTPPPGADLFYYEQ